LHSHPIQSALAVVVVNHALEFGFGTEVE